MYKIDLQVDFSQCQPTEGYVKLIGKEFALIFRSY